MTERRSSSVRPLTILESPEEIRLKTWLQLVRTFYRVHRRLVATLSERDITLPQFDVLATLRFSEGVTQQELAERLLVTKGNVTGVLDRLEIVTLVERRPDPGDARANRLYLTAAGRKKIESILPRHDQLVLQILSGLTDSDIKTLRRLLAIVEGGASEIE